MSRAAAMPPGRGAVTRYRLIQHSNGEWSLRCDGVERCRWNAAWPPAAILRITALAIRAETRRHVMWRRMAFAGRPVVYLLIAAPAQDSRACRSTRTGPRRPRPGPGGQTRVIGTAQCRYDNRQFTMADIATSCSITP